jgi:hypothetical protein
MQGWCKDGESCLILKVGNVRPANHVEPTRFSTKTTLNQSNFTSKFLTFFSHINPVVSSSLLCHHTPAQNFSAFFDISEMRENKINDAIAGSL